MISGSKRSDSCLYQPPTSTNRNIDVNSMSRPIFRVNVRPQRWLHWTNWWLQCVCVQPVFKTLTVPVIRLCSEPKQSSASAFAEPWTAPELKPGGHSAAMMWLKNELSSLTSWISSLPRWTRSQEVCLQLQCGLMPLWSHKINWISSLILVVCIRESAIYYHLLLIYDMKMHFFLGFHAGEVDTVG